VMSCRCPGFRCIRNFEFRWNLDGWNLDGWNLDGWNLDDWNLEAWDLIDWNLAGWNLKDCNLEYHYEKSSISKKYNIVEVHINLFINYA